MSVVTERSWFGRTLEQDPTAASALKLALIHPEELSDRNALLQSAKKGQLEHLQLLLSGCFSSDTDLCTTLAQDRGTETVLEQRKSHLLL